MIRLPAPKPVTFTASAREVAPLHLQMAGRGRLLLTLMGKRRRLYVTVTDAKRL